MKQNTQFVVVIFFVTLAFLVMLNDVRNNENYHYQNTVDLVDNSHQSSDLGSTDFEDEE